MKKLLAIVFAAAVTLTLSMPAMAQDQPAKHHHHRNHHKKHHKQAHSGTQQENRG
jgi:hypothetical protein